MNTLTPKDIVARISGVISLVVFGYWLGNDDMGKAVLFWLVMHTFVLTVVGLLWLLGQLDPKPEATGQEG